MESSPWEDRGQFYQALGDLKFSYTSGSGLAKRKGGLKFSILVFGGGGQGAQFVNVCLLIPS